MNKKDLKKIMKPLVKECINEILIEEGLLSNVVSEVVKGLDGGVIVENNTSNQNNTNVNKQKQQNKKLIEARKKMMDSIGTDAYNGVDLFEGTTPISSQEPASKPGAVDLGSSADSGVDISSLVGGASQIWEAMK